MTANKKTKSTYRMSTPFVAPARLDRTLEESHFRGPA